MGEQPNALCSSLWRFPTVPQGMAVTLAFGSAGRITSTASSSPSASRNSTSSSSVKGIAHPRPVPCCWRKVGGEPCVPHKALGDTTGWSKPRSQPQLRVSLRISRFCQPRLGRDLFSSAGRASLSTPRATPPSPQASLQDVQGDLGSGADPLGRWDPSWGVDAVESRAGREEWSRTQHVSSTVVTRNVGIGQRPWVVCYCGMSGVILEGSCSPHREGPGRVHLCQGRFSVKWRWRLKETTEVIKGLKTSLMQKELVVAAQEMIRRDLISLVLNIEQL